MQVVVDKLNTLSSRGIRFPKFFPECGGVNRGALLADLDKPPAPQRRAGAQHTTGARALILVILPVGPARCQRDRPKHSAQEWTGPGSNTSDWTEKSLRLCVKSKNSLPMPQVGAGNVPYAPALD